jgi:type I restriction enzyme R subunit
MRVMVKRLLKKYGYPPDKTEHAMVLVLAQAEVVCEEWAA